MTENATWEALREAQTRRDLAEITIRQKNTVIRHLRKRIAELESACPKCAQWESETELLREDLIVQERRAQDLEALVDTLEDELYDARCTLREEEGDK